MSVIIDTTRSEIEAVIRYARDGANNCMIGNSWEIKELVRCKDCVHCADDWNGNQPMFTCELGMCGESVQPNDFCSYGERGSE